MSIKAIKEVTGFSYSTISRVLSGKAKEFRISEVTRQAIFEAAEKIGYRPNILARSLRLRRTMTIGLIVSDIQNPYFGEIASRIEQLLRQHGYSTILCNANEVPADEALYLQILIDRQVDGILVAPIRTQEWDEMERLGRETAVVLIDRVIENTALPCVTSENTRAAEEVTRRLIGQGHRRIAFVGGRPQAYITRVRYQGFENAMKAGLGAVDESLVLFKGYSASSGEELMETLLALHPDVEAVLCVNNLVFFGGIKAVNRFEMRTGRSLMLAGFDLGEYRNLCARPLISADQDLGALATSAVELLLAQIAAPGSRRDHVLIPIDVSTYRFDEPAV
jgi:LacI family transcriptional regulator